MEVIPLLVGENILQSKTIYFPAGHGKSGFIARQDIAELSAVILTTPGHEQNIYEVSGEQAYDFEEVAELISEVSGVQVNYVSPSVTDFIEALKGYGLPPDMIELSTSSARAIVEGEFDKTSDIFKQVTGEKPTNLRSFLQQLYDKEKQ